MNRTKISATVDPHLLDAVDAFVASHSGYDRSKVLDAALRLWYAEQQSKAMEEQYSAPPSDGEDRERLAWKEIQRAAADRLFRDAEAT